MLDKVDWWQVLSDVFWSGGVCVCAIKMQSGVRRWSMWTQRGKCGEEREGESAGENPHHSSTFLCDWISLCSLVRLFSSNGWLCVWDREIERVRNTASHLCRVILLEKEKCQKNLCSCGSVLAARAHRCRKETEETLTVKRGLGGSEWGRLLTC